MILSPHTSIYSITYNSFIQKDGDGKTLPVQSIKIIIDAVAKVFNLNVRDLTGKCRKREYCAPRHLAMYLCRKKTCACVTQIGQAFNKDHTTVLHAVATVGDYLSVNDENFMPYWDMWLANAPKYLL